jgi:hypothetical protein
LGASLQLDGSPMNKGVQHFRLDLNYFT